MNDTRSLIVWGGAAGAVALAGLLWVSSRASLVSDERAKTAQLATDLAKAQPSGVRLDQQLEHATTSASAQGKALERAATALVPPLKPDYQIADLTSATSRVANDAKSLRQRAQRTRVTLPPTLPFDGGLDADTSVREQQLAQMYLIRSALDLLMDAGIDRISSAALGPKSSDPTGSYAVFSVDTDVTAPYEAISDALQRLQAAHQQGLGLRSLTLTGDASGKPGALQRAKLTITLMTPAQATWKLPPDKVTVTPAAALAPTSKPTPSAKPSLE